DMPEVRQATAAGRLRADGRILLENGSVVVTKAAIEPVWWLPGVAERFGVPEADLRRALFEETGGMYPELVTRGDLEVFLPPIGGRRRCAGDALPGMDAGRAARAGHSENPRAGVDEQPQVRRDHRIGHRSRRACQAAGRVDPGRRARRDGCQEGGGLLLRRR